VGGFDQFHKLETTKKRLRVQDGKLREKGLVTSHMIRDTKVKYSRSKGGGLGDEGYKIIGLSYDSNMRSRMLDCLELETLPDN